MNIGLINSGLILSWVRGDLDRVRVRDLGLYLLIVCLITIPIATGTWSAETIGNMSLVVLLITTHMTDARMSIQDTGVTMLTAAAEDQDRASKLQLHQFFFLFRQPRNLM